MENKIQQSQKLSAMASEGREKFHPYTKKFKVERRTCFG
jgi:hypothetical protein